MLNGITSPVVCTTNTDKSHQWFVYLNELFNHPLLNDDEKLFGMWLANHCANDRLFTISFNYEELSKALNKPVRWIHRTSFRLKIMGFLSADIPIWYGEPTFEMRTKIFTFQLIIPVKPPFSNEQKQAWIHPRMLETQNSVGKANIN